MTRRMTPAPRGPAPCPGPRAGIPAAAIAALLLAGCSSGHIGDSWQCPLAKGGACDSVAAADPAVPDADATRNMELRRPLYLVPDAVSGEPASPAARCEPGCGGFDPFAWLVKLFRADPGSGAGAGGGEATRLPDSGASKTGGAAAQTPAARASAGVLAAEPAAALPAEAGPSRDEAAQGEPDIGDLRTGEVVARIWIAPFVDADGVYREASHVRVVLEPAGWRVP
ncbi:MAG: TraV family lipoprotein [Rhodospirillaceae bacterium]|nr:TraV family lipoprotein [Rhodospirillaceae bacterium]MDE0379669.1 TraV family lipoprotein [Rhodospirillales bacterium]